MGKDVFLLLGFITTFLSGIFLRVAVDCVYYRQIALSVGSSLASLFLATVGLIFLFISKYEK